MNPFSPLNFVGIVFRDIQPNCFSTAGNHLVLFLGLRSSSLLVGNCCAPAAMYADCNGSFLIGWIITCSSLASEEVGLWTIPLWQFLWENSFTTCSPYPLTVENVHRFPYFIFKDGLWTIDRLFKTSDPITVGLSLLITFRVIYHVQEDLWKANKESWFALITRTDKSIVGGPITTIVGGPV